MSKLKIAVQVYSVRDDAARDFRGSMKQIKDMGYDGVELAGLYDLSPQEIRDALQEFGLTPISAHVPYAELVADLEGTLAKYELIGMRYIAIPYLGEEDRPTTAAFPQVMEEIKKIGAACNAKGMTLLYHNHDFEFEKVADGRYGLDYLYETVGDNLLQTEIDTCWVKVSGVDPAAYIRKYSGRAPVVHLKDYVGSKSEGMYELIGIDEKKEANPNAFQFKAVGYGCQDMPSILAASEEAGASWVVVEQDLHYDFNGMEDIKRSIDYLKSVMK